MRLPLRPGPPVVLEIDLTRGLLTRPPADPLSALRSRAVPVLGQVLAGLRLGAADEDVVGAVVRVAATTPVAVVEELGAALRAFSATGRPVVAHAASFGELGPGAVAYYLAAHADTVWLQPSGSVGLTGVALEVTTVRGALDKIGAEPQLGQRQEYKSAAETFLAREVSEPNREMTTRIATSVMEQVLARAAEHRGATGADPRVLLDDLVAEAPLGAARALEVGLVDRVGHVDEVYAALEADLGGDATPTFVYAERYARRRASAPREQLRRRRDARVGVVQVTGGITTGRNGGSPLNGPSAGADSVCAALRLAREDEGIRAVVLRIDSPGGSYVASDAIRAAVLATREAGTPVVASMAGVAASGGYFAAMPCDRVVALPSTLTGSIGVLGGKVSLSGTFERLGLAREAVGSHPDATMFSTVAPFDDEQWAKVDRWLDEVYADFTTKAAHDRGLDLDVLEPVARGRVWTGADARERGLVDELGGLRRALEIACELGGTDPGRTRPVPVPAVGPLTRLFPADSTRAPGDAASVAAPVPFVLGSPEALVRGLVRTSGLELPGVLTLPWAFSLG